MSPRSRLAGVALAAVLALAALALYPEPPATLLTPPEGWSVTGSEKSLTKLGNFAPQSLHVRRSVMDSAGANVYLAWTPDKGILPLEVASPPFHPEPYLSVTVAGTDRTQSGRVQVYLECDDNRQRLEVFRGSLNVHVTEALVVPPRDWCHGTARMKLSTSEPGTNVGIGSVFAISALSYAKSAFVGRLPYLLLAVGIFGVLMLTGACIAARAGWHGEPLVAALVSLGLAALAFFYVESALPVTLRRLAFAGVVVVVAAGLLYCGRDVRRRVCGALAPYAAVWSVACLAYFSLLGLASNGLAFCEPNYRFWPAIWSTDNQLPWLYADAIRGGWDLASLFGSWKPTDRPPLMAGAHLLVAEPFALLQSGNDGQYLRGHAYNAAALALNALWVPACWWLLTLFRPASGRQARTAVLALVGCLPVVIFNTIYGWPKAFGAAFALVACGIAASAWLRPAGERPAASAAFFVLAALSMLAHASTAIFLGPIALLVAAAALRSDRRSLAIGVACAAALLLSWSVYKGLVLPSADPLSKYALTGDPGFADPDRSLWSRLAERYGSLDLRQWLEVKRVMAVQAFVPIYHAIAPFHLNPEAGADAIDRLRAWDALLLSRGNALLLAIAAAGLAAGALAWHRRRMEQLRADAFFLALVGASLATWAVMILAFFAPIILPVWPQAALFGLAFGGAAVAHERYPRLFAFLMGATLLYAVVVWLISPIRSALAIDAGAAAAFALTIGFVAWSAISRDA